jgi:hypothetical protein
MRIKNFARLKRRELARRKPINATNKNKLIK